MEKAIKTSYASLDELRIDKRKTREALAKSYRSTLRDSKDCFLPSDNTYFESSASYMRYIGYAITMYKTFKTVNKFTKMLSSTIHRR